MEAMQENLTLQLKNTASSMKDTIETLEKKL